MSIQLDFNYSHPSGTVPSIEDWAAALPEADQTAFAAALERQNAIFLQILEEGNLTIVGTTTQVWQYEEDIGIITHDPVWQEYFNRYIEENGITLSVDQKQV
jgi:hypothetical protein